MKQSYGHYTTFIEGLYGPSKLKITGWLCYLFFNHHVMFSRKLAGRFYVPSCACGKCSWIEEGVADVEYKPHFIKELARFLARPFRSLWPVN